ncbi:MAG: phosphoribosylformylglycinamidine synthase subunit PurS [Deltaproteobacteria bacterium]|nr:phosphoribosylformylglycinamidine synthase subunit PurS [Deltaproteobacteria bacterium]
MRVQVLVRLKPGVLDVQGKAVEKGLQGLGFSDVDNVRVGRLIELDLESDNLDDAKAKVSQMCEKLLVNGVIENFEFCTL